MKTKIIQMVAKTSFGFEDLLSEELKAMGATEISKGFRAVYFSGTTETLYKANLHSRLALRILLPLTSFPASSEEELYEGVKKIDWSVYMNTDDTLAVDAVAVKSNLTHSLYVSLKTKDAIVDQFRDKTGTRPNVDLNFPTLRINVHLSDNVASVSLDSSGSSLHKRGYRQQQGEAPLNETLAAAMVMLSGWDKKSRLTDLMCGSGTILIEAALMAGHIAPGIFKQEFGFHRWKDYDADLWNRLVSEARANEIHPDIHFTGIDKSAQAIRFATQNASSAGVGEMIEWINMDFTGYTPPEEPQMIISNPPYGGRLTDDDLFTLYSLIGDKLKKNFSGSTAWMLTANQEAAKKIGLHSSAKIPLFNGALECRFLKFELYKGSKKAVKNKHDSI